MQSTIWLVPPDKVVAGILQSTRNELKAALIKYAQKRAVDIENYMKRSARWTDRTGNLRQSLHAHVEVTENEIILTWDYGLGYGWYLEYRYDFNGRYAIINPTFDRFLPIITADIRLLAEGNIL